MREHVLSYYARSRLNSGNVKFPNQPQLHLPPINVTLSQAPDTIDEHVAAGVGFLGLRYLPISNIVRLFKASLVDNHPNSQARHFSLPIRLAALRE